MVAPGMAAGDSQAPSIDGALSSSVALQSLSQSHGTTLAPATPAVVAGQASAPSIAVGSDPSLSSGTLTSSTFGWQASDGFSVNSSIGPVSFMPLDTDTSAQPVTIVNSSAAFYGDAWPSTDLTVRPDALGASAWLEVRAADAPMSYAWDVSLEPSQSFVQLADGAIAIVDSSDSYQPPDLTSALALDPLFGQGDSSDDDDPSVSDSAALQADTSSTATESADATSTATDSSSQLSTPANTPITSTDTASSSARRVALVLTGVHEHRGRWHDYKYRIH